MSDSDDEHEVRVWDLETLEPLKQPAGGEFNALVSDGEEVWGSVRKVVVWG